MVSFESSKFDLCSFMKYFALCHAQNPAQKYASQVSSDEDTKLILCEEMISKKCQCLCLIEGQNCQIWH